MAQLSDNAIAMLNDQAEDWVARKAAASVRRTTTDLAAVIAADARFTTSWATVFPAPKGTRPANDEAQGRVFDVKAARAGELHPDAAHAIATVLRSEHVYVNGRLVTDDDVIAAKRGV